MKSLYRQIGSALAVSLALFAGASPASAVPDLTVETIAVDPTSATNGDTVTVSVTVRNEGDSASAESKTRIRINQNPDAVTSSDPVLCSGVVTASIAPSSSRTVECEAVLVGRPAGENHVWAIADVNQDSGETDSTNNRRSTPLTVSNNAPDLVVESIVVDPPGAGSGDSISITATIRNQGTTSAPSSTARVRINQDPTTVGPADPVLCNAVSTSSIAAGASVVINCKPNLPPRPPGTNYIWVIADVNRVAGQSDITNDRASVPFDVPFEVPDFVVESVSVNPTSGPNGKELSVNATLRNQGIAASEPSTARVVLNQDPDGVAEEDPVFCPDVAVPAVAAGSSYQLKCKPIVNGREPGAWTLWVLADVANTAGQLDTDNDRGSTPFTVTSEAPDLIVQNLSVTPSSGPDGQAVVITATVLNQGNVNAAAFTTRFRINQDPAKVGNDDTVLCEGVATSSLKVDATVQVKCNAQVSGRPPGENRIWATADATRTAGQLVFGNDSTSTAFSVDAPLAPDLAVQSISSSPSIGPNGKRIVVSATIRNVGNVAAAASFARFRVNLDPVSVNDSDPLLCDSVPTAALAVGASATVKCSTTLVDRPQGNNILWVTADAGNTAGQLFFGNDRARASFVVTSSVCTDTNATPTMTWPLEQPRVLQDYASWGAVRLSNDGLGYHSGMDLVSQLPWPNDAAPVYAAADGQVVATHRRCPSPADEVVHPPLGKCNGGWGNTVLVRHGADVFTLYAHLSKVEVRNGCVERGQRIGLAGSSGSVGLPNHLHFDVLHQVAEPYRRKRFGSGYYRKSHPLEGRSPEKPSGALQKHLDPRDFFERHRVRLLEATSLHRGAHSTGELVYANKTQQFISYGELAPGWVMVDLTDAAVPDTDAPFSDDGRYGWIAADKLADLGELPSDNAVRIDGLETFRLEGLGANFVVVRAQPDSSSPEVSKAWGGQFFAKAGAIAIDGGSGERWVPIIVVGSTASGSDPPRKAWIPEALLGGNTVP